MEFSEFKYSLKIWLTSVLAAPVIMIIFDYAKTSALPPSEYISDADTPSFYLALVVLGGIFSLVPYILFYLIIKVTASSTASVIRIKSIVSISGILITIGLFALLFSDNGIGGQIQGEPFYLLLGNCLCIGWCSWFYRLEANKN